MTDLTSLTLAQARDGLAAKSFSALELTDAHLAAIEQARANGCFFEINSSPDRLDLPWMQARLAARAGVKIAVSTDAHSTREYDLIRYGIDQARRAGLGKDWQPPLARLGAATRSAGDTALTPLPAAIPWRRWLLWGVLVVAAAVVGGLALGLLRGAQREPPPR